MLPNFQAYLTPIERMNLQRPIIALITLTLAVTCSSQLISQSTHGASRERGEKVYETYCTTCHLPTGKGIPGTFPPLAKADYLINNRSDAIRAVKQGMEGEVTVNSMTYNNVMYSLGLDDQQVVDVMNYILNNWGNDGAEVTLEEVKAIN
ncbi:MAG: cytochrome c [Cyclobacteriaceae bacterium]